MLSLYYHFQALNSRILAFNFQFSNPRFDLKITSLAIFLVSRYNLLTFHFQLFFSTNFYQRF